MNDGENSGTKCKSLEELSFGAALSIVNTKQYYK
jgi:hypothetical protein